MKVMAIDYGDAHTGVAISDITGMITGYSTVINEYSRQKVCERIAELVKLHSVTEIVVGKPLNMNGTYGERAQKCQDFADMLKAQVGLNIVMWDERRTSVDANRMLSDAGKKRKKQKQLVDAVAASLILQGYLDYISMRKSSLDK